jgi:polysaccharide pyruvyl transferase WcaK-like protein
LEEKNYSVKWVLLQRESSPEINYYLRKVDYITWEPNQYSIQEFLELFNRSKLIISSRMHAIYIAGITKTPFIAIELHPKLRYSSSLFYREPIVLSPFFNNKDIIDSFSKIFEFEMDHRELKKQKIKLEILSKKFHDWLIS